MVRDGEFLEEGVDLKVFFPETSGAVASIAGENQTGRGFESVCAVAQEDLDAVLAEVFRSAEDRLGTEFGGPVHHEGGIPSCCGTENIGVSEE